MILSMDAARLHLEKTGFIRGGSPKTNCEALPR